jgi:hypothetical protein
VADTTAVDGNDMDAVAASLIDAPPKEDEDDSPEAELQQPDEGDAPEQQADEADESEAEESDADDDEDAADDDGEADAEDDEPAEQLYTVKVDGREQQVPISELLRGYSGQAYIQKGMQYVAEAKQQAESVYTALQSERQQLAALTQQIQSGQVPMAPPQAPSEELLQSDPIGYLEAKLRYDKQVEAYQGAQAQLREVTQQQSAAQQRAMQAHLAEEHRLLTQAIPAFAKPETAKAAKAELINAATQIYGYNPDELQQVSDHRALRVLHDAAQYRRLLAGRKPVSVAPQGNKTPTIKPGAKPPAQGSTRARSEKAKAQMQRSGSVDDVAKFLLM